MEKSKEAIFVRLGDKWFVKSAFLRDIYFLMQNDLRFSSLRGDNSIRYTKVSKYLKENYGIEIKPRQLKYLVLSVKAKNYVK